MAPPLPGEVAPLRSAADDPKREPSAKERREAENVEYPGGPRNPWRACKMFYGLRVVG